MNKQHQTKSEQSDYLWDRSGSPDPEIQRLERVLEQLRFTHVVPPAFPNIEAGTPTSSWWATITSIVWMPRFAAAAVCAIALVSALLLSRSDVPLSVATTGWDVEWSAARSDGAAVNSAPAKKVQLKVGETFETDRVSVASIAVREVGRLDVEPSTRLRLLQSSEGRKRIALDRGTIHAAIWAPPGEFVVDTPSATAVDLGCMYTLQVDEAGGGLLRTTLGWVGFRSHNRESFIPAGAAAVTRPQSGPGTPYFEDASESFRNALSQFDGSTDPAAAHAALQTILPEARSHDGLTLWHLLSRAGDSDRAAVFDRLAALVPPPVGVTRDGILRLDRAMLDSWWNALDLGDIGLWRHWEQSWAGR
jgi:hypothetical protein